MNESTPVFVVVGATISAEEPPVFTLVVDNGLISALEPTKLVICEGEDTTLVLTLRDVVFTYGEPAEFRGSPEVDPEIEVKWRGALALQWPTGLRCVLRVPRS
jgi:hypothetical protein